jgi:hypothetical protein
VWRQCRLTMFATTYGQASTVFPVLVASPAYFLGILSLGILMQTASAFQRGRRRICFFYRRLWQGCRALACETYLLDGELVEARGQDAYAVPALSLCVSDRVF